MAAVPANELVPRLLVNQAIIERQGVASDDATRLALVPSIVPLPFVHSVLIATSIGRNAAPVDAAEVDAVKTPAGPRGLPSTATTTKVPKLLGKGLKEALDALSVVGLESRHIGPDNGVVIEQEPQPGLEVSTDSALLLVLGAPATPRTRGGASRTGRAGPASRAAKATAAPISPS